MSDVDSFVKDVLGRLTPAARVSLAYGKLFDEMKTNLHRYNAKMESHFARHPEYLPEVRQWWEAFKDAPIDGFKQDDGIRQASIAILNAGKDAVSMWTGAIHYTFITVYTMFNPSFKTAMSKTTKQEFAEYVQLNRILKDYRYILASDYQETTS